MSKAQEALDELYFDATNGENELIKQKYIRSINENKEVLQELVDRATPKKPEWAIINYTTANPYGRLNFCPTCKSVLVNKNKPCHECSQAIDWIEDE